MKEYLIVSCNCSLYFMWKEVSPCSQTTILHIFTSMMALPWYRPIPVNYIIDASITLKTRNDGISIFNTNQV